jgi:2-polyprenyl-3-methyl-5-hydroxy-6-metoxy-1,4-benzoquinol methylase
MRIIEIKDEEIIGIGKHCVVVKFEGRALKIFTTYPQTELTEESLKEFHWGDYCDELRPYKRWVRLPEASVIQNICWLNDLAPRVYEIMGINYQSGLYFGQLQDIQEGDYAKTTEEYELVYEKVKELGIKYGFKNEKDDVSDKDVKGGKLIDFNTFHFTLDHTSKIREAVYDILRYGKIYYQNETLLDMNGGPRKSEDRVEYMKLNEIDFTNKTVSDLGCAGGYFCRYSKKRGATKVTGYDFEDVIRSDTQKGAYLLSFEYGTYDIDFIKTDLRINKPEPADIVFMLSMNYHIGIPKWLPEVTKEMCIFEDNSKQRDAKETLEKMFKRVELIGYGKDHGDKIIYHCYKE